MELIVFVFCLVTTKRIFLQDGEVRRLCPEELSHKDFELNFVRFILRFEID